MRPDTLAPSYLKFVENLSPVEPKVMKAMKECTRKIPIENWKQLNEWAVKRASPNILKDLPLNGPLPKMVPCTLLHPQSATCTHQQFYTFKRAVKMMFPIYLTINFVPSLVARFFHFIKSPLRMISKVLISSGRSTVFMTLVSMLVMGLSCLLRKLFQEDSTFKFYLICFLCGIPVILEEKSKRAEFALYVLPRATESLYQQMTQKKIIADLPGGSILLFSLTISLLMYFREYEHSTLSPFLKKAFDLFLPKTN